MFGEINVSTYGSSPFADALRYQLEGTKAKV